MSIPLSKQTRPLEVSDSLHKQLSLLPTKYIWNVKKLGYNEKEQKKSTSESDEYRHHPNKIKSKICSIINKSQHHVHKWIESRSSCKKDDHSLILLLSGPPGSGKYESILTIQKQYYPNNVDILTFDYDDEDLTKLSSFSFGNNNKTKGNKANALIYKIKLILDSSNVINGGKKKWIILKGLDKFPTAWITEFEQLLTCHYKTKLSTPLLFATLNDLYCENQLRTKLVLSKIGHVITFKPVSFSICSKILMGEKNIGISAKRNLAIKCNGNLHQLFGNQLQVTEEPVIYESPFELFRKLFWDEQDNKNDGGHKSIKDVNKICNKARDIEFFLSFVQHNLPNLYSNKILLKNPHNNDNDIMTSLSGQLDLTSEMDIMSSGEGYEKYDEGSFFTTLNTWGLATQYQESLNTKKTGTYKQTKQLQMPNFRWMTLSKNNQQLLSSFYEKTFKGAFKNKEERRGKIMRLDTMQPKDLLDIFALGTKRKRPRNTPSKTKSKKKIFSCAALLHQSSTKPLDMEWLQDNLPEFKAFSTKHD